MVIIAALATASAPARAQDYPTWPVRIVVPTGPGGGYDVMARLLSEQMSTRLGQSVFVENRIGAGTIIGTQAVIAAQPDG